MNTIIDINTDKGTGSEPETLSQSSHPQKSHGHKPRERKDIASGAMKNPTDMIRLAFAPDGQVVADIYGKLPGRGAWIAANRAAVEKAIKTGAFARAAKRKTVLVDNFADTIAAGLAARLTAMIGMAKRAGQLETGFENVRSCARAGELAIRIEASNGQPDGRSKIRVVVKALANELETPMPLLIGCFNSAELGKIVGRDSMVHACVRAGKMAKVIRHEADRLAGFRELVPNDWPDRDHEAKYTAHKSNNIVSGI